MLQDWTIYSWYCPNCKTEVCGIKDKKDHLQIDIYAPDYDESIRI